MSKSLRETNPEKYAALTAEAQAPFRSLRLFIYGSCVVSAGVGGLIIFLGILAGRNLEVAIPNFAVNAGVVALTTWLFIKENNARKQAIAEVSQAMKIRPDQTPPAKPKKTA